MRNETWADIKMDELREKGRQNWDEDDWEAYNYIEEIRCDSGFYED